MLTIRTLRTTHDIADLKPLWVRWQHGRDANIDFFLRLIGNRPEVQHPYVLVASKDGAPCTILVGRREQVSLRARVGYRTLFTRRVSQLTFVPDGLLGHVDQEVVRAMMGSVIKSLDSNEGDVALMSHLEMNSDMWRAARQVPFLLCRDYVSQPIPHWRVQLPLQINDLYQSLSRHTRHDLRTKQRRLERQYGNAMRVGCLRTPDDFLGAFADMEVIAANSYQRTLRVGFRNDEITRKAILSEAAAGSARGYVLYLEGQPAAFWVGSLCGITFYADFTAFDSQFRLWSPGLFLLMKMIERLCSEGVQCLDFGMGDARYKRDLANMRQDVASLYVYRADALGYATNIVRSGIVELDHVVKTALHKADLLECVKGYVRRTLNRRYTSTNSKSAALRRASSTFSDIDASTE